MRNVEIIKDCCGCAACQFVCPVNAISMSQDREGFYVPTVSNNCVKCGKCLEVCTSFAPMDGNRQLEAFAAFAFNNDLRRESTSGAIFPVIAKQIIDNTGAVVGATFDAENELYHTLVSSNEGLYKLMGSKYLQSNMEAAYTQMEEHLKMGKPVFFVGTPCQVVGVKRALQQYATNLYTADLICHGCPSPSMFAGYISHLEKKYRGKIVDFKFREKRKEGISYDIRIKIKKKSKIITRLLNGDEDPYILNFLTNRLQRKGCFNCAYSKIQRVGDLTLGDYWGHDQIFPYLRHMSGVSLLLVNSQKGNQLLEAIRPYVKLISTCEAEFLPLNSQLEKPAVQHPDRDMLYDQFAQHGFTEKFYQMKFIPKGYRSFVFKRRILQIYNRFIKNI